MRVVGRNRLLDFVIKHADAKGWLEAWLAEVEDAEWDSPPDVKLRYPQVSILADNIYIFNVKGNHYRLAVQMSFGNKTVVVKRLGTHAEYDRWTF